MNKVHDKGSVDLLLSFHFFFSFFKALLIIGAPLPVPRFFYQIIWSRPAAFLHKLTLYSILNELVRS